MTVREQVLAWGQKYSQPEDIMSKALARADVCDSCEENTVVTDGDKQVNTCAKCGCRLIRTAFNEAVHPCPLLKFNEPAPPPLRPASSL